MEKNKDWRDVPVGWDKVRDLSVSVYFPEEDEATLYDAFGGLPDDVYIGDAGTAGELHERLLTAARAVKRAAKRYANYIEVHGG